ncbi:serine hydrolase domain-containing protein [Gallaecimonas sp. GXIMD4217]|uniref:serine hydrolase domain-containing protein n=1 Tax=Gallaecimonas sp. GXIMD4217 TaxID=3131927 RepID=UPI00311AFFE6
MPVKAALVTLASLMATPTAAILTPTQLPVDAQPVATVAAPAVKTRMDAFMTRLREAFALRSGTAVILVRGDAILYRGNFGQADIESREPVRDDTLFYIASITKPLFALAALQELAARGQGLDTSLAELFPGIAFAPGIDARAIKVRHLLNHSAGLDDELLQTALYLSGLHDRQSRLQMLARVRPSQESKLGQFDYTNLGYNILSQALGRSWQDVMADHVFRPLGMTRSTARVSEARKAGWSLARPYDFFTEQRYLALPLEKRDSTLHAAGGVYATAGDLARLLTAELNLGKVDGRQLLPQGLVRQSQQQTVALDDRKGDFRRSGYGLGWYLGDYKGRSLYHHFGSFEGFRPHLSFMPQEKLGLVILNNEGMLNDRLTDLIADYAYGLALGEPDLDARLDQRIAKLKAMAYGFRDKRLAKEAGYRDKPYQLSLPRAAYLGHYRHPLAGTLTVQPLGDQDFRLDWGHAGSASTAMTEPDSIRVKFRPSRAQVVQFDVEGEKVQALRYAGITFSRTGGPD